jgi:superfamily II DNA or RNA helicase
LKNISKKCYNAKYKIGVTGTLSDSEADKLTTFGYVGPNVYTLKSKTLIDMGYLSTIDIKNYIIRYNDEITESAQGLGYAQEVKLIESLEDRNFVLSSIIDDIQEGNNILVLAKHIKHMKELVDYLKETYPQYEVHKIDGSVKGDIREDIRKNMTDSTENQTHILVASYATVAVGVNITNLHDIIFAASYKSKIKILQAIGRGLRKHVSKINMTLHDMVDDFSFKQGTGRRVHKNKVYKHYEQRKLYYDDQGFEYVDIDFDVNEMRMKNNINTLKI